MEKKNSELHRYQQESELKRKKNKQQQLYSSLNWTYFCQRKTAILSPARSINESNLKRLEKHKLGFLKGENLSVLLYLFSRFFNYLMSTYRIISHLQLNQPSLPSLFQMIFSAKSHFDKMLTVIFKYGYCICIDNSMICSDIWHIYHE